MVHQVPKGALIALSVSGWGGQVSYPTENSQVHKVVDICPREFMKPMTAARGIVYRCLSSVSLPFPVQGVRYVPEELIPQAEQMLQEAREQFQTATDEFTSDTNWVSMLASSRATLRESFPEDKIPSQEKVRDSYRVQYSVFSVEASPFDVQGALGVQDLLSQFRREAYQALVSQLHALLSGMAKRLQEGKRFHASTVTKLGGWLNSFPILAAAIDGGSEANSLQDVRKIVDQARSCLEGVLPEDLKTSASLRESIGVVMDAARAQLVVVAGPDIDSIGHRALTI